MGYGVESILDLRKDGRQTDRVMDRHPVVSPQNLLVVHDSSKDMFSGAFCDGHSCTRF